MKNDRLRVMFGLILALAVFGMGCGLTERLSSGLSGDPVEPTSLPTRTPWPTFTPTPESVVLVPTQEPADQEPTAVKLSDLATAEITPPDTPTPAPPTNTPTPEPPPTDTPPPPTNTPAAPAPPPAAPPEPPPEAAPPAPQYQFTPGPWYAGDRNDAIVRFYGYLKDTNGTPVNGYSVRATCGDTAVLSFPSGPSPVAPDWAPGWYDIVFNPISCNFTLQVVEYQCETAGFDAQCNQFEELSEAVPVTTDVAAGETIIVAEWIKNW
jgi:hypothetical protein